MARNRLINLICTASVAALAAVLYWVVIPDGIRLPRFGFGSTSTLVTPRLVPQLFSMGLLIVSVIHFLIVLLRPTWREAQAPVEPWLVRHQRRALVAIAFVSGYILIAIQTIGFYTSTAIALALGFALLGERSPWRLVLIPLLASAFFYFIFERLFNMFLPRGFLF